MWVLIITFGFLIFSACYDINIFVDIEAAHHLRRLSLIKFLITHKESVSLMQPDHYFGTGVTVKPETLTLLNFGESWFKGFWQNKHRWTAGIEKCLI